MTENKSFCTVEYLDEDGHEIVDHAVLSVEEQMKLMDEFISCGVLATIYEHTSDVNSSDEEENRSTEDTNIKNQ